MTRRELLQLAEAVLTIPTAPYHEHGVRTFVSEYCRRLDLPVTWDAVGNVSVRYRHRHAGAPLVMVAHMDHPGFEARGGRRVEFLGGVPPEMFPRARVRFGPTVARVTRVTGPKKMVVDVPLRRGDFGMWDLPAFRVTGDRLRAIAIDDVLSVAALLATLAELKRQNVQTHLWAVFTRAEEVGFHGAIEVARSGIIPKKSLVISLEMSKERPWARIGHGPVVRLGDRLSLFDAQGAQFLTEVARPFRCQRAVMDGGACEASAFAGLGYRVMGLCLPLGNYHNIGPRRRPQPEYVSVRDLTGLVDLMAAAAAAWPQYAPLTNTLRERVLEIYRRAPRQWAEVEP